MKPQYGQNIHIVVRASYYMHTNFVANTNFIEQTIKQKNGKEIIWNITETFLLFIDLIVLNVRKRTFTQFKLSFSWHIFFTEKSAHHIEW